MNYAIGLDIGIASVGWAIVALDSHERPCGIIGMGARVFDAAEGYKGASLAKPRRDARGTRRRLRRHRHRNQRIRKLIVSSGLLTQNELDSLFSGRLEDIYELRVRALDEAISAPELARILIHLAQRRGFRSNRRNVRDTNDGAMLTAIDSNSRQMADKGYRTVAEMLLKDPRFDQHKRNKGGDMIGTVLRSQIEDEARQIFAAQRQLGSALVDAAFEEVYLAILLSQRSFDEGPGGDSPYGGDMIADRMGSCTFIEGEKRAARASYSFEYFALLEKINHIRILEDSGSRPLSQDERSALIKKAHETADLNYAQIRKALALPDSARFNTVRYKDDDWAKCEKGQKLGCMKAYHTMRNAFEKISKGLMATIPHDQLDAIATALTLYRTSANIQKYLEQAGIPQPLIEAAETVGNFTKSGHLSLKACRAIIPHLEKGMNYSDACAAAGFNFKGHDGYERTMLLHPKKDDYEDLTSPVVRRAVSQTIKVVNAIIRKQGASPMFINVELARDLSRSHDERDKLTKEMEKNRKNNELVMQRLRDEFGLKSPSWHDVVKLKLYEQQDGVCPYSLRQLSASRIFDPEYAEVDHIMPYSKSFDDSYKNKVLVFTAENRNKGNRLPLEYLQGQRRDDYTVWVKNNIKDYRKRQIMLKERITEEEEARFIDRNLQDTRTASRFILNYLNDRLLFAPSETGRKKRVTAVSGGATAYVRKRWGINKVRANGDVHHAVDALVVACITDGMLRRISSYAKYRELRYSRDDAAGYIVDPRTGEVIDSFPYPWPQFHKELDGHLSSDPARVLKDAKLPMYASGQLTPPNGPIFVSRVPDRKITGAAHEATVHGTTDKEGIVTEKTPLQKLQLDSKTGQIKNYPDKARASDPRLYDALVEQLRRFGGNGEKAFAQPFHKPTRDGSPGPVLKTVKLEKPATLTVPVHGGAGAAENVTMVRTDVFYVEGEGYYLVPIYVADTLRSELPDRACVKNKPHSQWKVMRDEDFLFSLYKNDLIKLTDKKPMKLSKQQKDADIEETVLKDTVFLYYKGMDVSDSTITCVTHDNAYKVRSKGVKTLSHMEKYTVDVLGEYHPVGREKRQRFSLKKRKKR